jgi:cell division protease FtsH
VVGNADFEEAKDKVMMGAERRSMVMSEDEKKLTAYHEAGHALVGLFSPKHDPLHKVTIIPRGRALGVTMSLPERDRLSMSKLEIESRIAMTFGGRIAEELIFGPENVTTGASNDIKQATEMARRMVTEWGMSDKLGRLRYTDNQEEVFLGHSITQQKHVSDATARMIDEEVRHIVEEAEARARSILGEHLEDLKKVAEALLEYETLSGEEVKALLRGESIFRPEEPPSSPADSGAGAGGVRSAVPSSRGKKPSSGREPTPQPGA